eukprot:TRINITY_DN7214_c0_g1_i1.p1 TRINITY_DN7214_c0_g1~~TRINITY_DN7214_c0_g1_i1.p1  ORF type:complete len:773 (-),score=230.09 TRINITY_DN7214_c0_g1_i1:14-2281(-)
MSDDVNQLCKACWENDTKAFKAIVKKNASAVLGFNDRGQTPLYCAARNNHWQLVKRILSNPSFTNCDALEPVSKSTALHAASHNAAKEALSLLLSFGCNIKINNLHNNTAEQESNILCIEVWKHFNEASVAGLDAYGFPVFFDILGDCGYDFKVEYDFFNHKSSFWKTFDFSELIKTLKKKPLKSSQHLPKSLQYEEEQPTESPLRSTPPPDKPALPVVPSPLLKPKGSITKKDIPPLEKPPTPSTFKEIQKLRESVPLVDLQLLFLSRYLQKLLESPIDYKNLKNWIHLLLNLLALKKHVGWLEKRMDKYILQVSEKLRKQLLDKMDECLEHFEVFFKAMRALQGHDKSGHVIIQEESKPLPENQQAKPKAKIFNFQKSPQSPNYQMLSHQRKRKERFKDVSPHSTSEELENDEKCILEQNEHKPEEAKETINKSAEVGTLKPNSTDQSESKAEKVKESDSQFTQNKQEVKDIGTELFPVYDLTQYLRQDNSLDTQKFVNHFELQVNQNLAALGEANKPPIKPVFKSILGFIQQIWEKYKEFFDNEEFNQKMQEFTKKATVVKDILAQENAILEDHLQFMEIVLENVNLNSFSAGSVLVLNYFKKYHTELSPLESETLPTFPIKVPFFIELKDYPVEIKNEEDWAKHQKEYKQIHSIVLKATEAMPTTFPQHLPNLSTHNGKPYLPISTADDYALLLGRYHAFISQMDDLKNNWLVTLRLFYPSISLLNDILAHYKSPSAHSSAMKDKKSRPTK